MLSGGGGIGTFKNEICIGVSAPPNCSRVTKLCQYAWKRMFLCQFESTKLNEQMYGVVGVISWDMSLLIPAVFLYIRLHDFTVNYS